MSGVGSAGVGGVGTVGVVISEPKEPEVDVREDEQPNDEEE